MERQSSFSRSVANHAKMGAYYTDTGHCRDLYHFLEFPKGEVSCLEPSIGDGEAIFSCVQKEEGDLKKIFGVEISDKMKPMLKSNPLLEDVLIADFLNGVHITPQSFGFCFSNPPYMEVDGIRMERSFLDKIHRLLKKDGVLVYVIPENVFKEKSFFRFFYNRFSFHYVWRFRKSEYEKWHQVAIIATKRGANKNVLLEELTDAMSRYEELSELPSCWEGKKVPVPEASSDAIEHFTSLVFPKERCLELLMEGKLAHQMSEVDKMQGKMLTQPVYQGAVCGKPPIKPNKDSMYLLGVCGAGNGICGNEEEGNVHLQRGVVKTVDDHSVTVDEKGNEVLVVTTRAQITYNVIENDGHITHLV